MEPTEIAAQIIGIVAMAMNCLSYQQKRQNAVLALQLCGSALFVVNFFLLGAFAGALLNAIAILRAVVFMKKDKLHTNHPAWLIGLIAAYLLSYILVFTVFGKEANALNLIVEMLPVIGMTLMTVAFRYQSATMTRRFGMINSPLWLVYNIFSFSIGAICCESLNIASIIIGILRIDRKKTPEEH